MFLENIKTLLQNKLRFALTPSCCIQSGQDSSISQSEEQPIIITSPTNKFTRETLIKSQIYNSLDASGEFSGLYKENMMMDFNIYIDFFKILIGLWTIVHRGEYFYQRSIFIPIRSSSRQFCFHQF